MTLLQNPYWLYPATAPSGFSIIQNQYIAGGNGSGGQSLTLTNSVTSGNSVIVVCSAPNSSTTTLNIAATIAGNAVTFTPAYIYVDSTNGIALGFWYLNSVPAGSLAVTVSPTNYFNFTSLQIYETSPLIASPVLATTQVTVASTVSPQTTIVNPATQTARSFGVTAMGDNGNVNNATDSITGGWVFDLNSLAGATNYAYTCAAHALIPANTSPNCTWTITGLATGKPEDYATVLFGY